MMNGRGLIGRGCVWKERCLPRSMYPFAGFGVAAQGVFSREQAGTSFKNLMLNLHQPYSNG